MVRVHTLLVAMLAQLPHLGYSVQPFESYHHLPSPKFLLQHVHLILQTSKSHSSLLIGT